MHLNFNSFIFKYFIFLPRRASAILGIMSVTEMYPSQVPKGQKQIQVQ